MDKGKKLLESEEWQNASPEQRRVIFARRVAKDPDFANANAQTQKAIAERFGIQEPEPAAATAPATTTAEAPAEVTSSVPSYGTVEPLPAHIADERKAEIPKPVDSTAMAGYGAGVGAVKGLLEKYMLSPDKLQRDLYARAIRNAMAEAGVNVMGVKDERALIDLARQMMPKMLEGQQAQLGSLQQQADVFRSMIPPEPPISATGFPSVLEGRASGPAVPGGSAASNWMRAMAGEEHQIPESILASAEDMTKTNPKGGQALIRQDLANLQKIRDIGAGNYQLVGQGRGQFMVPQAEVQPMAARTAAQTAEQAQIAREALGVLQPQIATVEAEIARLTRLGKDTSQFTARLEQLRRMERTARTALGGGLNIPAQANVSPLARIGLGAATPSRVPILGSLMGPTAMNTLAGAGAFYDITEAFDRKDPLGAAVHGISGLMNIASMVPPVNLPAAVVKGAGTLGALSMLPVKMMLPPAPSVTEARRAGASPSLVEK